LTATIHGTEQDLRDFADLIPILENKGAGSYSTSLPGLKFAMPWFTEDHIPPPQMAALHQSAATRFSGSQRPICYQGFPDSALPDELKDANPLGIWRMVNGEMVHGR